MPIYQAPKLTLLISRLTWKQQLGVQGYISIGIFSIIPQLGLNWHDLFFSSNFTFPNLNVYNDK